ncbi:MAG: right-handed parallel beta-helix repeat-containing protein [Pseudonocardiaceae bacterium]
MRTRSTKVAERSGRSRGPWLAIMLSLLAFATVLAAAVYVPGWLSRNAPTRAQPGTVSLEQARLERARSQAALVAAEDTRLLSQLRGMPWASPAYLDKEHGAAAAILTTRRAPYTLESLLLLGAAERIDASTVALINSVLVGPGAKLILDAPGTTLRLTSTPTGFTSLVGWKGSIELIGAPGRPLTLTSWDPATNRPDQQVADGRAYVRVAGSDLQTHFTAISHLGFWSGRTGGLAVTGSESAIGTGSITDTTVHANHYGFFSSDTNGLTIADSTFDGATADGILLHQGSTGTTIRTSTIRGNTGSGVVADRGASEVTLRHVTAERNGTDGIRFDGRPLAERPGAAGASLDGQRGFRVQDSAVRFNAGNGVLVWDADDTVVAGTGVVDNAEGIVVRGATKHAKISTNAVTSSAGAAIAVRDGATDVTVDRNTVASADTGVQVRSASADVQDNTITGARAHGVSFQGAAQGSAARGNTLAGSGPSGVDLARLDAGVAVSVVNNSEDQWQVTMSVSDRLRRLFLDRPLLALWASLLVLPIVASLLGQRRRRQRQPAHPYPDHPALAFDAAPIHATGESIPTVVRFGTSASPPASR